MSAKTIFMAGVMAVSTGSAIAQASKYDDSLDRPDLKYTSQDIAICYSTDEGKNVRYPTEFANKFWSRLSCAEWKGGYKLLEAAPKSSPDRGIPSAMSSAKTAWTQCYWNSFPYGQEYHRFEKNGNQAGGEDRSQISHGAFGFKTEEFEKIQRAVVYACDVKLGFIKPAP